MFLISFLILLEFLTIIIKNFKAYKAKRIDKKGAFDLLQNVTLAELGVLACERKLELHPEKITTLVVDRNINCINVRCIDCDSCAFYRHVKEKNAYILSYEEIGKKAEELEAIGGMQILFQGDVHPKFKIEWYENLVEWISKHYPNTTVHGFSAVEIMYIAKISKISIKEVLKRFQAKGLFPILGAGAGVLNDRVRDEIAPYKYDTQTWLEVYGNAHQIGMKSMTTMMSGMAENDEKLIEHFEHLGKL